MMTQNISIKAFFTTIDEIHRFVISTETNFLDFSKQLATLYNQYVESSSEKQDDTFLEEFEKKMSVASSTKEDTVSSNDLILKYQDDEDDWVMLKSEHVRILLFLLIFIRNGKKRSIYNCR
jgi:hypothetical protein